MMTLVYNLYGSAHVELQDAEQAYAVCVCVCVCLYMYIV
jgi:hypothetical protein